MYSESEKLLNLSNDAKQNEGEKIISKEVKAENTVSVLIW